MPGVPAVPLSVDAATAKRLIASGAFSDKGKGDPIELTDAQRAALDLFVPAVAGDPEPEA
jgi:hypothetical protein